MNYSTFEQAAVEARTALKEIDAEIERLKAKKDLLATLGRQLLSVLPMCSEATDEGNKGGTAGETPAGDQAFSAAGLSDGKDFSLRKDTWPTHAPTATATAAPVAAEPSLAEVLSEGKPYSLRKEGWPSNGTATVAPPAESVLRGRAVVG